ncbi:MAG: type II toxin-antitoxin system RatA family toxin [Alphaproteobacteria bacterium]
MPRHSETRFLPYTPEQLFDLVADIERYPEFLPWCAAARIVERKGDTVKADLIVGYKALREKFTSVVTLTPKSRIDVAYAGGPLSHLKNDWRFTPAPGGCDLSFDLEFALKSTLLAGMMEAFLEKAIMRMAQAFEERAKAVYG